MTIKEQKELEIEKLRDLKANVVNLATELEAKDIGKKARKITCKKSGDIIRLAFLKHLLNQLKLTNLKVV